MKLKPYNEIIAMAKDKVNEALAPARAHRAKKQAELKIAEIEENMATQETLITEIASEKDIEWDDLIEALDDIAILERRKSQFKKIISEMFPKEK
ncbi:MAG: hypothetical protein ACFFC6_11260 [Promethearchaeota archaeon]